GLLLCRWAGERGGGWRAGSASPPARRYRLFDYVGHPEAERVLVAMGSGAEVAHETVEWLVGRGEKVGLVKVRLYRPFSVPAFAAALPKTTKAVAGLDPSKEPGAIGRPPYLQVVAAPPRPPEAGLPCLSPDPLHVRRPH